ELMHRSLLRTRFRGFATWLRRSSKRFANSTGPTAYIAETASSVHDLRHSRRNNRIDKAIFRCGCKGHRNRDHRASTRPGKAWASLLRPDSPGPWRDGSLRQVGPIEDAQEARLAAKVVEILRDTAESRAGIEPGQTAGARIAGPFEPVKRVRDAAGARVKS